ncbi:hypothetical protein O181_000869 [Austropuccinia psidii MF-1]|uniref:DUF4939 domain-containing protein n=1 Tax=Austropuccinia psidii MF-1 TaxID=1389203 RepID=A0A9Q3GBB3_9BASI|nr:hypothetical protein [Austropuccinia psidii MF-1]
MEGSAPSRKGGIKSRRSRSFSGFLGGYLGFSQGPRSRLGGESEETEVAGAPEASENPNPALSNQPLVSQAEPDSLKMMQQMTQFMEQLNKEVFPRKNSQPPAFKTPSMKAPDSFDGTQAHKLIEFIQYFYLIVHNDPESFFSDIKKVLYLTSFLTGKAGKWTEPYLSNISNEDPSYLLNNWKLFETQLFTLFGDPNEGEGAYIHFYKEGLASRPLDQLASYPGNFGGLQELIDTTLEVDNRYHERQKERGSCQERKAPVTGFNSLRPTQYSSSKKPHHKKIKKQKKIQVSKDKPHAALLNKNNKFIGSEKERRIEEGLCTYCGGKNQI